MGLKKQSKNHTGGPEEQQSLGDGTGIEKKKKKIEFCFNHIELGFMVR